MNFRNLDWAGLIGLAVVFLVLFLVSYLPIEIKVIFGSNREISRVLGLVWRMSTGLAAFLSLSIGLLSYRSRNGDLESDENSGLDTVIQIGTEEGNIDLSLVFGKDGQIREYDDYAEHRDSDTSQSN